MANQTTITDWCLSHSDICKPKITTFTWVKEWLPDFHDFQVKMEIDGHLCVGRGADRNQRLALEKAFAEAIERYLARKNKLYFHGVAVNSDENEAKKVALLEFIERKTFFQHFPDLSSLGALNAMEFGISDVMREGIERENFEIKSVILRSSQHPEPVVATKIQSKIESELVFLGIASHAEPNLAFEKTLLESFSAWIGFLETGVRQNFFQKLPKAFDVPHQDQARSLMVLSDLGPLHGSPVRFAYTEEPYIIQVPVQERLYAK